MVLIIGSKSEKENSKLTNLVPEQYRDFPEQQKREDFLELQKWTESQLHLPKLTDYQLLLFLHSSNYDVEKAKKTLDNYFTIRTREPELFTNRNPQKVLARSFTISYYICMPEIAKSYQGNNLLILKLLNTDPDKAIFSEGVKAAFALLDLFTAKHPLAEGVEIIMDMEGLCLGHIKKIEFSALRVFMNFLQDALPLRLKAIHVLNTFPLINQIMLILKPFLRTELLSKISFYTTKEFKKFTSKYVPLASLPSDFGGTLDSLSAYQEDTFRQMEMLGNWLEEIESYTVDESKRLLQMKEGIGLFRKLQID